MTRSVGRATQPPPHVRCWRSLVTGSDHDVEVPTPFVSWPFVGRERELAAAVDAMCQADVAGVFLVGPAGVGKTRLLDAVAEELVRNGHLSNRVIGAAATQNIPYAAIVHLLPSAVIDAKAPDPLGVFLAISQQVRADLPDGERLVLVVDDVALLDQASLTLLSQLVNSRIATVLATVRTGQDIPSTLSSLERSQRIIRMDIDTFDIDGVTALLEAAQGGTVDRRTSRALWSTSQGNALYLRELVIGALSSGAMTSERGHWRLVAPLVATSRLVEVVTGRLDGLSQPDRDLAEALSLAEPLAIDDIERAGLGEAAFVLDGARLVTSSDVNGATLLRLAHPLYGEVLRSQLTALRRRSLLLRIADAVGAAGRSADVLRLATWLTSIGAPVDPDIVREGARRARAANDFALSETLSRFSVNNDPDLEMILLLAEALHELGRFDEANDLLGTAAGLVANDFDRVRLAVLHHRVLLWGSSNTSGSLAVLQDAAARVEPGLARGLLHVAIANTLVLLDEPDLAFDVIEPDELEEPMVAGAAAHSRALALLRLGDPISAAVVAAHARTTGDEVRIDHPALLMNVQGFALCDSGDFALAEAVASEAYAIVTNQRVPQLQVWLTLNLGRTALQRGRPLAARRWFAEALSLAGEHHFPAGRRMALSALAISAGQLGDEQASATLLAELSQLPSDIEFLAPEIQTGRAWALVALGRRSEAIEALLVGIDRAESTGDTTVRLAMIFEAARIGEPGTIRFDVDEAVQEVAGPLAAARRSFVRGMARGSIADLVAAESEFAAIGAELAAADAAAALAVELARSGRAREAAAARVRGAAHQRHCEGATTPTITRRAAVVQLSLREREICLLASRGLASKAIARQLDLRARTVSNHLQNAYVKLGISNRDDLADALGIEPTTSLG